MYDFDKPIDMNDPEAADTAVPVSIPEYFSQRAKRVVRYFDGTLFLFEYKDKLVATDESLYLTEHGDGSREAPYGGPRWVGDSLEEFEKWLEALADSYDEDGDVPGWETPEEHADKLLSLIQSMNIKQEQHWFVGSIGPYDLEVKVTDEDSLFGIDNGRIIKLFITALNGDEIASYERGWDIYPEDNPEYEDLIDAVCEYFANRMDKEDQHDSREHAGEDQL